MLKGSADALWELARNPTLQLFATDWAGPPPSHATQAQENAAVLALSDFASLPGSSPGSQESGYPQPGCRGVALEEGARRSKNALPGSVRRRSRSMRLLSSRISAAGIALALASSAAGAAGARPGLSVNAQGVLVKDGRPFRGIGVNYFDAFSRHLLDPSDTSYEAGFAALARARVPFVRLMGCGFWPVEQKLYQVHREEFLRRFDDVVRAAERHHIGLIPSLFWNVATVPDLVGEPVSAWGDPRSKTQAYMRAYVKDLVTRCRRSPALWGWEFGNEFNLGADLPNAAEHRPPIVPGLGTPARRSEKDEWSYETIRTAFAAFARTVRRVRSGPRHLHRRWFSAAFGLAQLEGEELDRGHSRAVRGDADRR